jgi:integrase
MLVRLGLRAGEVAKLQLEHIDWRAGEIVIAHSKGNRTERLPLPADVGEAIAATCVTAVPQARKAAQCLHGSQLRTMLSPLAR